MSNPWERYGFEYDGGLPFFTPEQLKAQDAAFQDALYREVSAGRGRVRRVVVGPPKEEPFRSVSSFQNSYSTRSLCGSSAALCAGE